MGRGLLRACKKVAAIVDRLAKRGNNFSAPELGMALKRAKHLTRHGKRTNYEYIQKHPFVAEEPVPAPRKTREPDCIPMTPATGAIRNNWPMSGKSHHLQEIEALLVPHFAKKHVTSLLRHFSKLVEELQQEEWADAIAASGKFIEAVLKALFVQVGKTPPAGRGFKADFVINGLAQVPDGIAHDSVRLTIPRACRFLYDIASNRGGRHDPDEIDPNEMDANAAVMNCSWILAEMIRVAQKGAVE